MKILILILFVLISPLSAQNENLKKINDSLLVLEIPKVDSHRLLIEEFEGIRLKSYICPGGKVSIGFGSTHYENGKKVKLGDEIDYQKLEELYDYEISKVEKYLKDLVKVNLTDNQKSSLISFIYNVGYGNFKKSTLRKLINNNPNDSRIQKEFEKWIYAKGKPLKGLIKRRKAESKLYFT